MQDNPQSYKRKTKGAVILQAAMFIIIVAFVVNITADLHRGWTIINELSESAEIAATSLAQGNYRNLGEQQAAATALLIGNTRFVTDASQVTINWLNLNDADITDPVNDVPIAENSVGSTNPVDLIDKIQVTVDYPIGSDPPFPSGTIRAFFGGNEIPLTITKRKTYQKKPDSKHFTLLVRTGNVAAGTDYRPLCSSGEITRKKEVWDELCKDAARLLEPTLTADYSSSGITSGTLAAGPTLTVGATGVALGQGINSRLETWNTSQNRFTFSSFASTAACQADATSAQVIYSVSCFPVRDGTFTAPAIPDVRYLIIDSTDGSINSFSTLAEASCPAAGVPGECCTASDCTL